MEITEIKSRLTITEVLQHYHLQADKNHRLRCPFHDDKTPSLQIYPETNTCYCFSSRCKTHGKSMDVIDFMMHKEGVGKHEAILLAGKLIGEPARKHESVKARKDDPSCLRAFAPSCFLEKMFTYFKNALPSSPPAKEYLQSRCLDFAKTEVGYNSGQFHHGTRRDEELIENCLQYGLLLDKGLKSKTGEKAYGVFGKGCLCFALRNRENEITGLYFRSITNDKDQRHYYLKDRSGLYPGYPDKEAKTLILTESIIDAASLLELKVESGKLKVSENGSYSVLALYGTNGLTAEHREAIGGLDKLEEIILFFDGDEAGKSATIKYGKELKTVANCPLSTVHCPENEDINSLLQGHDAALLEHLIENRRSITNYELEITNYEPATFSFSTEKTNEAETSKTQNAAPVSCPMSFS